jgi:hypothetical protein
MVRYIPLLGVEIKDLDKKLAEELNLVTLTNSNDIFSIADCLTVMQEFISRGVADSTCYCVPLDDESLRILPKYLEVSLES